MGRTKRCMLTGAALVALLGPVGGGVLMTQPAGATPIPPVDGIGALTGCAAKGSVKFPVGPTPGSYDAKVSISFTACSGGQIATTVAKGKVTGTLVFTPTDASCAVNPYAMTGSLTVTYKVTPGSTPLNPSVVEFNQIQTYAGTPAQGSIVGVVTSGSFTTDGSYLNVDPPTGPTGCANKWKAGTGSTFELG